MLLILGLMAHLLVTPQYGVLPDVPTVSSPSEKRGNRHERRRDAKRDRVAA